MNPIERWERFIFVKCTMSEAIVYTLLGICGLAIALAGIGSLLSGWLS